jgi:hypothetical protein
VLGAITVGSVALCLPLLSRPVVEARKRMMLVVRLQMLGGGVEGL